MKKKITIVCLQLYDDDLLSFFNERAPRHMNPDAPMDISDPKHGVKMGVPTRWCDDGVIMHACLNETLDYESPIPTSGNHRPLWPVFGEYKYLPPQRYAHALEAYAVLAYENAYLLPNYESADEDMTKVIEFIKAHGLKGPEANTSQNGQYSAGIIEPAIPGNNALCPGL
ncbi:hypothetical protein MAR_008594 [Mya arenaria]|uniref:Uncharacterized protein n=1 Tax=Mya arenaria TaxID=6604 RepID=A0ABY7E4G4_MYAAR|nr:hypothetical protein MAR_008594 [Mya arenaria]